MINLDMDDDDGSGLCVYMHRHEDIGFWKATSCSREMATICEYPRYKNISMASVAN